MELQIMYPPQKDSPSTFLTGDITATDTLISVGNAGALPQVVPYPLTLGFDKNVTETVIVTAIGSGNNQLTVTRQSGALSWQNGTKCARVFTALDLKTLQDNVSALGVQANTDAENIVALDTKIKAVPIIQTAGGTGTAITLTGLPALSQGYSVTFIASESNGGAPTSINGKPAYKPGGTSAPNIIAGKAYTFWYDTGSSGRFFIKASAEGDANPGDVLASKKFSNDSDTGVAGTMPDRGSVVITPGTADQTITDGYHNGSGKVLGDGDLISNNIKANTTIFDVPGDPNVIDTVTCDVVAGDVLLGKKAGSAGSIVTGAIPSKAAATYSPSVSTQVIAAGQYLTADQTIEATTGTAGAGDVLEGKTFNSGVGIGVIGTLKEGHPVGKNWAGYASDPFLSREISSVAVSPDNATIIVCGSGAGNWIGRSGDGGITWSIINIGASTDTLYDVVAASNDIFFTVGNGGKVRKSIDKGLTWSEPISGPFTGSELLLCIAFLSNVLLIGTSSGKIYRSTNTGSTWTSITNSFTSKQISGFAQLSSSSFIAFGSSGSMAKSTNSGSSWGSLLSTPFGTSTINSAIYNSGAYIAVGSSGKIARSTDGSSWGSLITNPFGTSNISSITSVNGILIAVGDANKIAKSTDNGVTWSALIVPPFNSVVVLNEVRNIGGVLFTFGKYSTISKSTDNGDTWSDSILHPFGSVSMNSIVKVDDVIIAGGASGVITRSTDKGLSWSPPITNPFGAYAILAMINIDGCVIAVGATGSISRSTDKGLTWEPLITNPFGTYYINAITNLNGILVAVGNSGSISRSTDKGLTWEPLIANPFSTNHLNAITNIDGVLIVGGANGRVSRSTDKGLTWSALITTPFGTSAINTITNANGTLVIGGQYGHVDISTDCGLTWGTAITNPFSSSDEIRGVTCINGVIIISGAPMSGNIPEVARSMDGGNTWGSLIPVGFKGVKFKSVENIDGTAFILGDGGIIGRSFN